MTRKQKQHLTKKAADWYWKHQAEIVAGHLSEFVVVKGRSVLGYHETENQAFASMTGDELGTFIVQQCQEPGTGIANYYNDTVAFA
jgi:hypothetical protein